MIVGLCNLVGIVNVSIMDMPDRWGTGFAFFYDEAEFPGIQCPQHPDWLEGITSYQEGAPDCPDVWGQDWPWDRPHQMARIAIFRRAKFGLIPAWAFLGKARQVTRMGPWDWHESRDVLFAETPFTT